MIPRSGHRFSGATNAERVCAEIMRKIGRMIPKSGGRFSDQIMRKIGRMIPKSGGRFSDQIMRKIKAT
jgi:hypothetical protein